MNTVKAVVAFVIVAVLVVAYSSAIFVDETDHVIITQFGEFKRTISDPGLHFKVPFVQTAIRIEKRIMSSDAPPQEYFTRDKKRLIADPITRWKVSDPLLFYKTVRDENRARKRLDDLVLSGIREGLAQYDLEQVVRPSCELLQPLITKQLAEQAKEAELAKKEAELAKKAENASDHKDDSPDDEEDAKAAVESAREYILKCEMMKTKAEKVGSEPLKHEMMKNVTAQTAKEAKSLGIDVVDVRIKRADLPPQVMQSVFGRMKAERERMAKKYRAQGQKVADFITSEADREREKILAEAYRAAQTKYGEGDAKGTEIYAKAYGKDPEFYAFMRSLEAYQQAVDPDSSVVLSTGSQLFRYLSKPGKATE